MRKITTKEFIKRAKKTHGEIYDYSKSNYVSAKEKIIIICSIHGEFKKNPHHHYRGQGCPDCVTFSEEIKEKMSKTRKRNIASGKHVVHKFTKEQRVKARQVLVELSDEDRQKRTKKAARKMKGRPQRKSVITGAKTNNLHAITWKFINKAKGVTLEGKNLNQLIKNNMNLFDDDDLRLQGSSPHAAVCLRQLKPSKNRTRRIKNSWKGWTFINSDESTTLKTEHLDRTPLRLNIINYFRIKKVGGKVISENKLIKEWMRDNNHTDFDIAIRQCDKDQLLELDTIKETLIKELY